MTKKIGRPLKFKTPEEILSKGQAYFDKMRKEKRPITVTGLCMALDTSRNVLMVYEDKRGPAYTNAVKKLKTVCENYAEEYMFEGKNTAGAIFALKNYGWKDKQEIDQTHRLPKPLMDVLQDASNQKDKPSG